MGTFNLGPRRQRLAVPVSLRPVCETMRAGVVNSKNHVLVWPLWKGRSSSLFLVCLREEDASGSHDSCTKETEIGGF